MGRDDRHEEVRDSQDESLHRNDSSKKNRKSPGDPPEPIDYSPSSGAVDPEDAAQDVSTEMQTGRHEYTPNETYIGEEIESNSEKWDSLNEANRQIEAETDDPRRTKQDRVDDYNDIKAWCNQIGLTSHEATRAVHIFSQSEIGPRNHFGKDSMKLAAMTLAANEGHDQRNTIAKEIRPEVPLAKEDADNWVLACDYRNLRKDLDVDADDVRSCRDHLRQKL